MATVKEKDLLAAIKSGSLSGAYYLYGSDHYTISEYRKKIISRLLKSGDETYNLHEFEGKGLDVEGLSEACEALPMFAPAVCVTVRDLDMDSEGLKESRLELLMDTVKNLPETTVLIFYSANTDLCGGKKSLTPKNKKLADAVAKCGTVCEFPLKTGGDAFKVIEKQAADLGSGMQAGSAAYLLECVAGDLNAAVQEIYKLAAYKAGGLIGREDIDLLTAHASDAKVFDLADAAALGNIDRTMQLLGELLEARTEPIFLLYTITGSMNDLYRARIALDSGRSIADVMADFDYKKNIEFKVKNAFSRVRRMDTVHLRRCMEILADADIAMKTGAGQPEVILERAIVKMLEKR